MSPSDWAKAAPLLQTALDCDTDGDAETLDDVKEWLLTGRAQLWFTEQTAAVTYKSDNSLCVWLYGGSMADLPALFQSAAAWARATGLHRMELHNSRAGWSRALKSLGWSKSADAQMIFEL